MSDTDLMQAIRGQWGSAIHGAAGDTNIPEALLAALIANESAGHPDAHRFEPNVLTKLWEVTLGRKVFYGSIPRTAIVNYIAGLYGTPRSASPSLPAAAFQNLDELATSWGLTQIMGYHILEWATIPMWYRKASDLRDGQNNLHCAVLLATTFAHTFDLDLSKDFEALFRCWNAGSPLAATFDPAYVRNGFARMGLYRSLASGETGG